MLPVLDGVLIVDDMVPSVLSRARDEDRVASRTQAVVLEDVGVVDARLRVVPALSEWIGDSGTEFEPESEAERDVGELAQGSVVSRISPSSTGGELIYDMEVGARAILDGKWEVGSQWNVVAQVTSPTWQSHGRLWAEASSRLVRVRFKFEQRKLK